MVTLLVAQISFEILQIIIFVSYNLWFGRSVSRNSSDTSSWSSLLLSSNIFINAILLTFVIAPVCKTVPKKETQL